MSRYPTQLDEAKQFLREALQDSERPALEVAALAGERGIADITLRRARAALEVRVRKARANENGHQPWLWSLR